jgi:Lipase (class 3)
VHALPGHQITSKEIIEWHLVLKTRIPFAIGWIQHRVPTPTDPSGWHTILCPKFGNGNYAVILESLAGTSQLAIVIQGTKDAWQMVNDFDINQPGPFVNLSGAPMISEASIANGANTALTNVLNLEDGGGQSSGSAKSGIDWSNYSVLITGHSLGGTIASLLAPWLAFLILDQTPRTDPLPSQILAVTFAAFAAGKQQFADYLNNSSQYQPNINVNDIEPHVWATRGAYSVDYIYGTFPSPGPPIPDYIKVGLGVKVASIPKNFNYVQTNKPNTFAGTILPAPPFSQCPAGQQPTLQWEWEVGLLPNYASGVNYSSSGCSEPNSTECLKP